MSVRRRRHSAAKAAGVALGNQARYFDELLASQLEAKRDEARRKRRIAYDCFNAVIKGSVVVCARGYFSSSIPLITVLRGRSSALCAKCPDYDDGGEGQG